MNKQYDMSDTMSHEMTLSHEIEKRDAEIKALRAHVQALKAGVTHFNRSHGDMNPLLAAYVATPTQCLAGVKAEAVVEFYASLGFDVNMGGKMLSKEAEKYANKLREIDL